jgi:nucleotide-binding universal stress UspA family protein
MKTLLVIINSPADSDDLIRYSTLMAMDLEFKLHLLYIQDPAMFTIGSHTPASTAHPVHNEIDLTLFERDRKNALRDLENKFNEIASKINPPVQAEFSCESGSKEVIAELYISENKGDMLLLENQEEKGFRLLDPVNAGLVLKANCPGWIIPSGEKYQPFKRIVYATDYNEADIVTLKNLIALTSMFSPEITAIHIAGSRNFEEKIRKTGFIDMVVNETNYKNISVRSLIDKGEKSTGEYINEFSAGIKANLIVLLKENKTFIERIFKPGSAREVIKGARLPVLIYQE